jgi:hypothetical protein
MKLNKFESGRLVKKLLTVTEKKSKNLTFNLGTPSSDPANPETRYTIPTKKGPLSHGGG